jgi:hypothetical protein
MIRIAVVCVLLTLGFSPAQAMEWHGLFLAGDNSIAAFDNSQRDLVAALERLGLASAARYTASMRVARDNGNITYLTEDQLNQMANLDIGAKDEGCLVHLTSHGVEGEGFYLSTSGGIILGPEFIGGLLDTICGTSKRTVLLVSACYSGQIIVDAIKAPNRIILTAARADRPSFGCSAEDLHTYWDGCLIEQLPWSKTWGRLYENVSACITAKETAIGAEPSVPQAWFAEGAGDWRILN